MCRSPMIKWLTFISFEFSLWLIDNPTYSSTNSVLFWKTSSGKTRNWLPPKNLARNIDNESLTYNYKIKSST